MNSAATGRSTYARDAAEHFWPLSPKAERAVPCAATSRSACRLTITGFFPPISQIVGFGCSRVKLR